MQEGVRGQPEVRPYRDADAPAVSAMLEDASALDDTVLPAPLPKWRRFVARSGNRGGRDFLVAHDAGTLVAVATSSRMDEADVPLRHFRILVHPRARRRGVATAMLRTIEGQDGDRPTLQCNCRGRWAAGRAFLAREGFAVSRRLLEMERLSPVPPLHPPPEGVTIRPDRGPSDDAAWRRLHDLGYAGDPDYHSLGAADLEAYRGDDGFALLFAERKGEACGLCHVYRWDHDPWINSLVVAPAHRGRGIGRALLAAALRGLPGETVVLSVVADNAPAVAIYRGLGFRTRDETLTMRRSRARAPSGRRAGR